MEDNRIQNQIAIYMTNKKLCEFTDKLKPAPVEYYAHMHAQGEEQSDGFRAYRTARFIESWELTFGPKLIRDARKLLDDQRAAAQQ